MIEPMTLTDHISCRMTGSSLFPHSWEGWPLTGWRREAKARPAPVPGIVVISPFEQVRSTSQATDVISSRWETLFSPRTDLGKRLCALRAKAIVAGMKLLSEDEILEEVKRRRGEKEENEKDLY